MSSPVPPLVTLHVWRVPARGVPGALRRVATDRSRVRRVPGVRFAKVLGTGSGRTFAPGDADARRWGLLTCWALPEAAAAFETHAVVRAWDRAAGERFRAELSPVRAHGRWSGREPFGSPEPRATTGRVAAVTRARLAPRRTTRFWAAVPPVAGDLHRADGLLAALGVGESPVGLQGTVSLWRDEGSLRAFARSPEHAAVVARTPSEGWYAEELFARFEVLATTGTLDGEDLS